MVVYFRIGVEKVKGEVDEGEEEEEREEVRRLDMVGLKKTTGPRSVGSWILPPNIMKMGRRCPSIIAVGNRLSIGVLCKLSFSLSEKSDDQNLLDT